MFLHSASGGREAPQQPDTLSDYTSENIRFWHDVFLTSIKSSNICGHSETRDEGTSAMLTFSHILAGKAALSITFM